MATREEEILAILKSDPMISQNDLADKLGITRSSVSVYITSLLKKGLIKGRGYVISEELYPIIIGSVNVDLLGVLRDNESELREDGYVQEDSEISISYGGIAKNIAEELVRLGMSPKIISPIARDIFGNEIVRECAEHGISLEGSLFLENVQSSMYLELRTRGRDWFTGLTNMANEKLLTPQYLETKYSLIHNASQIVVYDGLRRETLDYVSKRHADVPIFLLGTGGIRRAEKHRDIMNQFDFIQISPEAALHIAGVEHPDPAGDDGVIREVMGRLIQKGAREILVPFSGGKIAYATPDSVYLLSIPVCRRHDEYAFYRDIIMGGMVYGHSRHWPVEKMLKFAAASRELFFQQNRTVLAFTLGGVRQLQDTYDDSIIVRYPL